MITAAVRGMQQARVNLARQMTNATDVGGVTVGIQEGVGVHPGTNRRPGTGETVAEVGAKNHFGSKADNIPARPWLDRGLESVQPEINQLVKKHGATMPLSELLERIGKIAQNGVQQYIEDLKTPPNSQETKDIKGSENPLVDSGIMMNSVTWEYVEALPPEGINVG